MRYILLSTLQLVRPTYWIGGMFVLRRVGAPMSAEAAFLRTLASFLCNSRTVDGSSRFSSPTRREVPRRLFFMFSFEDTFERFA